MRASPCSPLPALPGVASAVLTACLTGRAVLVLYRGFHAIVTGSTHIVLTVLRVCFAVFECLRDAFLATVSFFFSRSGQRFSLASSAKIVSTYECIHVCRCDLYICNHPRSPSFFFFCTSMQSRIRYISSCVPATAALLLPLLHVAIYRFPMIRICHCSTTCI